MVFLVDTSGSIKPADFPHELSFVQGVIGMFDVAPNKTRVAVVSFSKGYRKEFRLDKYDNATAMQQQVGEIRFTKGGSTDTHDAIRYARDVILRKSRSGATRIIICITDGQSTNNAKTVAEAEKTRQAGILVFAVGVGSHTDYKELGQIATRDTEEFVLTVENFAHLSAIESLLAYKACTDHPQNDRGDASKACGGKPADIVFVLDRSSSVHTMDFQALLKTVRDIVRVMDIAINKTQIAAVSFGTNVTVEFFLNQFVTKSKVIRRIGKIQYYGGITETGQALRMAHNVVLSPKHGARGSSVARVVIVVTDGKSQKKDFTKAEADSLKKDGILMFAVGVGKKVDSQELKAIASRPLKNYLFKVGTYGALESIQYLLAMKACDTKV